MVASDRPESGSAAFDDTSSDTRAASPHRGRGDAWGIGALLLLVAVVAIACADPAGPARDPRCVYVGDTVGVIRQGRDGVVIACTWLLAEQGWCEDQPIPRTPAPCVVGGPMYGRAG